MILCLVLLSHSFPEDQVEDFAIGFGSCHKANLPQPLWRDILKDKPDVWIWGGDNVYANTHSEETLRAKYAELLASPGYAALKKSTRIVGIWDDHDFGSNNMGGWNPSKEMSERLFLEFMEEPEDSPRRQHPGIYTSYTWGDSSHQIKVILLDTRYFMEPPGPGAGLLGEAQWQWLEDEFRSSRARVHILVSGIQILSPKTQGEQWANYPQEKSRLLSLIEKVQPPGLILLSGDKHYAQFYQVTPGKKELKLVEVTSSGMTHNRNILRILAEKIYKAFQPATLFELNYCLIKINWKSQRALLQIKTQGGRVWKSVEIRI